MDSLASDVIEQIAAITGDFGVSVTVTRVVQAATPTRNVFGNPTNATTTTSTVNVIVESLKENTMATMAGGKPKWELRLIVQAGVIIANDEITYQGHTYKVLFMEPVPLAGTDVVNFAHAEREVD